MSDAEKFFYSIFDAVEAGFWPIDRKELTYVPGLPVLEDLGFKRFYIGKNADLYFIPGPFPSMIMVRTDRASVFDIPLNLVIQGKGVYQNKISHLGYDFVESLAMQTARLEMPAGVPEEIAERSMCVEMCRPLEIFIADDEKTDLEYIRRMFLTGSLFKKYKEGKDPYGLRLPYGLKEWTEFETSIFTPTTKGEVDVPLRFEFVEDELPAVSAMIQEAFDKFYVYAQKRGIVIADTKFEVAINSKNEIVFIDEVLTPESSRFIDSVDFDKGIYKSMDKQILRDYGEAQGWKEQAKSLEPGEKLDVYVPEEILQKIIDAYKKCLDMLKL